MKGSRVQNVVQELQGERIDIVTWSPDPAKYVYNALAPAHVSMVMADEENRSLLVVVPNDQLSLAIGRQGQNVRLAAKLIGWRIDVKSEQRYANLSNPGYQSLLTLPGVDETLADQLLSKGVASARELAGKSVEELMAIRALDEDSAAALIEEAKKQGGADTGPTIDTSELESAKTPPDETAGGGAGDRP
jgi:N utilization substance protein A